MATMEEQMMFRFMDSMEKVVAEFKEHQQGLDVALQAFLELNHIKCPPWLQKPCSTATEKASCNPSYGEELLVKSSNPNYGESLVKSSNPSHGEPLGKASNPSYEKSFAKASNPSYENPLIKASNPSYLKPLVKAPNPSWNPGYGEPLNEACNPSYGEAVAIASSNPSCGEPLVNACNPGFGEPLDKAVKAEEGDAQRMQKNRRVVSFLDEVQTGLLLSDCSGRANKGATMTRPTRNSHNRGLKKDASNNPITAAVVDASFSPPLPPVPVEAIGSSSIAVKMEMEATAEGMGRTRGSKRERKECVEVMDCSVGVTTRRTRNNQKMGSKRDASNCENAAVEAPSSGPVSVEVIDSSSIGVKMEEEKAAEVEGEKEGVSYIATRKTRGNKRGGGKHAVQDSGEVSEPLDCSGGVMTRNDHKSGLKKDASSSPVSVEVIASSLVAMKMEEEEAEVGEKEGIHHIGTRKTRGNNRGLNHVGKESREVSELLDCSGGVMTGNEHNGRLEKDNASSSPVSVEVIASSSDAVKMAEVGEKEGIHHIGTGKTRGSKRGQKHVGKENREVLGPLDCSGGAMTRNDRNSGSRRDASSSPVSVEFIASSSIAVKMEEEESEVEGEKEVAINKGTGKTRGNKSGQKHGVLESRGVLEPLDCLGGVMTRNDHNSGSKRVASSSPVSVEVVDSLPVAVKMEEEEAEVEREKEGISHTRTGRTRGNKRGHKHVVQESREVLEPLDYSDGVMTRNDHNSGLEKEAFSSPVSVEVIAAVAVKMEEENEAEVEGEREVNINKGTGETRGNNRGQNHVVQESREVSESLDCLGGVTAINDHNRGLEKDASPSSVSVEGIASSSIAVKMEEEEVEVGEKEPIMNKGTGKTRGNKRGCKNVGKENREVLELLNCAGGNSGGGVMTRRTRNYHNRGLRRDTVNCDIAVVETIDSQLIAVKMEESDAEGFEAVKPFAGEAEEAIGKKTRGLKRGHKHVGKEEEGHSRLSLSLQLGELDTGEKKSTPSSALSTGPQSLSAVVDYKEAIEKHSGGAGRSKQPIRNKPLSVPFETDKGWIRLATDLEDPKRRRSGGEESVRLCEENAQAQKEMPRIACKEGTLESLQEFDLNIPFAEAAHAIESSDIILSKPLTKHASDDKVCLVFGVQSLLEEKERLTGDGICLNITDGFGNGMVANDKSHSSRKRCKIVEESDRNGGSSLPLIPLEVELIPPPTESRKKSATLAESVILNQSKSNSPPPHNTMATENEAKSEKTIANVDLGESVKLGLSKRSKKTPSSLQGFRRSSRKKTIHESLSSPCGNKVMKTSDLNVANGEEQLQQPSPIESKTLPYQIKMSPSPLGKTSESEGKNVSPELSAKSNQKPEQTTAICDTSRKSSIHAERHSLQRSMPSFPSGNTSESEGETVPTKLSSESMIQIKMSPSPLQNTSESEGNNVSPKLSDKLNQKPEQTIAICDASRNSSIHADRHSLKRRMPPSPLRKTSESEGKTVPMKLSGESTERNLCIQRPEQTIPICDPSRKGSIHTDRHSFERKMPLSPLGGTNDSEGETISMRLSDELVERNPCAQKPDQTIPICNSSRKSSIHTDKHSFERRMPPSPLGKTSESEGETVSMKLSCESMERNPCTQKTEQITAICDSRKSSIHTDRHLLERRMPLSPSGKTRESEGKTVSMKLSYELMEGNPCTQKTEQTIATCDFSRKSSINTDRHSLERRTSEKEACNNTLLSTNCLVPCSEMSLEALNGTETLSHGTEGAYPEEYGHAEMVLGLEDVAVKRGMLSGIGGTIYPMETSRGSMEGSESPAIDIEIDAPVLTSFRGSMGFDTPRMEYPYGSLSDYYNGGLSTGGRDKRTPLTPAYTNLYDKNLRSPGKRSLLSFDLQCFRIEEEFEGKENANPDVFSSCKSNNNKFSVKKKGDGGGGLSNRKGLANRMASISDTDGRPFNIVANVRSFLPLVQQKQPAVPYPNGKRDVKVKALQAAEAAKRVEEKREQERRLRKLELAKAEKEKLLQPKYVSEHLFTNRSFESQDIAKDSIAISESQCPIRNRMLFPKVNSMDNASDAGNSPLDVLSKVKRVAQQKQKLEEIKAKQQEEGQRKKEEERKKKEAELVARKRKREEADKKEREEKRKRVEEVQRVRKEQEERQRLELEQKEQRRKALEERERERKALEEEAKRQRRIDKEKEAERRRRQEQEAKSTLQAEKELKKKKHETELRTGKLADEGYHELDKLCTISSLTFGEEQQLRGGKISGVQRPMSNQYRDKLRTISGLSNLLSMSIPVQNCNAKELGLQRGGSINQSDVSNVGSMEISTDKIARLLAAYPPPLSNRRIEMAAPAQVQATLDEGIEQSYEISPYKSDSDDEDEEEGNKPSKPFPSWTRKENLMVHLLRQQSMDPDIIFLMDKTCSLQEIFGTVGSKRRRDFTQRSDSGDWLEDRVTWKEEMEYKKSMGYIKPISS